VRDCKIFNAIFVLVNLFTSISNKHNLEVTIFIMRIFVTRSKKRVEKKISLRLIVCTYSSNRKNVFMNYVFIIKKDLSSWLKKEEEKQMLKAWKIDVKNNAELIVYKGIDAFLPHVEEISIKWERKTKAIRRECLYAIF
jgi:hypothetical protein